MKVWLSVVQVANSQSSSPDTSLYRCVSLPVAYLSIITFAPRKKNSAVHLCDRPVGHMTVHAVTFVVNHLRS